MTPDARPVLVYLVTEDWYFLSHRLPMALSAQAAGYEVHVATHLNGRGDEIERHGFKLHPLNWRRGSLNPFDLLRIVRQVRALYRQLQPDLVHHVALQPSVIGSIAAYRLPIKRLNAMAGLGFSFTSATLKARVIRPLMSALLSHLMKDRAASALVQNPDDRDALLALGLAPEQVAIIPGSGVDTDVLVPLSEPQGPVTVGFVGRLLDDKGVRPLVEAHQLLRRRGRDIQLVIAGDRDPANPSSISEQEVAEWKTRPGVTLLGHVSDIGGFWSRAHIAVLPSRREGLPKSLLEAAACGRPLVATDVPGCREIARQGVNALMVPPDQPEVLAAAIDLLVADAAMRQSFGQASRQLAEEEFSSARIGPQTVALYDRLLCRPVVQPGLLPQTAPTR